MSLKEEIGGIIYDAGDIYKAKVTTGQLNNIVDDIMKTIAKTIDSLIEEYNDKIKKEGNHMQWNQDVGAKTVLEKVKELLK